MVRVRLTPRRRQRGRVGRAEADGPHQRPRRRRLSVAKVDIAVYLERILRVFGKRQICIIVCAEVQMNGAGIGIRG